MENENFTEVYYNKALYFFSLGLLDQALENFNKVINVSYELPEALNTAAIIYMYKGNFNQAYKLFSINVLHNQDVDAKKYLVDFKDINQNIDNYNKALDYISGNDYNEAIKILEKLIKYGFNTQDLQILLCILYYLQNRLKKSMVVLEKIHDMDKGCMFYVKMKKALHIKRQKHKMTWYLTASVILCFAILTTFLSFKLSVKPTEIIKYTIKTIEKKVPVIQKVEVKVPVKVPISNTNVQMFANLVTCLSNGDYYNFERYKRILDYNKLSNDNKKIYKSMNEKFLANAPEYFYQKGKSIYKSGNYKKAYEFMVSAYKYRDGTRDEHILYKLALSAYHINSPETIKYLELYSNNYINGEYIDEILNNLARLYNKKGVLSKAKLCAGKIKKDSEYFTDEMVAILAKK